MLISQGVHFRYRKRYILQNIDVQLMPGESVALLGANGSGKSTLIRLLLGLLSPDQGQILLHGRPLSSYSSRERARQIAYVPQAQRLSFPYTVEAMVAMGRHPHQPFWQKPGLQDRPFIDAALERMGIAALRQRRYTELSGGQRQLVLLARALAQGAGFLLLDEPITGLDYGNQQLLLGQIRELAREGYGVLQSTHYPEHALSTAERVILLHEGRILADGATEKTLTSERIATLYGVSVRFWTTPEGRTCLLPVSHVKT